MGLWLKKFSLIVRLHYHTLLRRAHRVCRTNTTDAQDLVRETRRRGLERSPDRTSSGEAPALASLFTARSPSFSARDRPRITSGRRCLSLVEPDVELAETQLERWRSIPDQ